MRETYVVEMRVWKNIDILLVSLDEKNDIASKIRCELLLKKR